MPASHGMAAKRNASAVRGILFMVAACALVSLNDSITKWLTRDFPLGQILCLRGVVVLVVAVLLSSREGGLRALRIRSPRRQLLRAGLVVCGMFLFLAGLRHLPLADAIALSFASPLFATVLAVIILRERVGLARSGALLVGFAGIVFMLRPGGSEFAWVALLPLVAAAFGALGDVITRQLCRSDSSSSILLVTTAAVCVAGLATAPFGWSPVDETALALLAFAGLLVALAQYCMIEALRYGEVTLIAPFRYMEMAWATLFGFLIFSTIPEVPVVLGAALVIGSGAYIFRREAAGTG